MKAVVILAAGGSGRRLKAGRPKAFVELGGRPLFFHAAEVFASLPFVREIVLVLPPTWLPRLLRLHEPRLRQLKITKLVPGGPRRQDSVWNGLSVADPANEIVLVHDAARPFVTQALVRRVAAAARMHGAAVPALPVTDTLKRVDGARVVETPPRAEFRAAQTPQGFRRDVLVDAYRKAGKREATDDTQLVEWAGGAVVTVEGDPENFKVTTPDDYARARARLL